MSAAHTIWSPQSWQRFPAKHQPPYSCAASLKSTITQLRHTPPLVSYLELSALQQQLQRASCGQGFVLHAGDCAELYTESTTAALVTKANFLHTLAEMISQTSQLPVTVIGRLAGQYAKPRSQDFETNASGARLLSYRGDAVNHREPTPSQRQADPKRLLQAYNHAAEAMIALRQQHSIAPQRRTLFFSHEALLLGFESAMTRYDTDHKAYYNASTHYLWVGNRTRQPEGAHVEYMRGISNPIGLKVDHKICPKECAALVKTLNPANIPGKITLISRFGYANLNHLPRLIQEIQTQGLKVLWSCDPMHANTFATYTQIKTRLYDNILKEWHITARLHQEQGSWLGGVHLELSPYHVTECLGGPEGIREKDLERCYTSACDPRLNQRQSQAFITSLANGLTGQQRHELTSAHRTYRESSPHQHSLGLWGTSR